MIASKNWTLNATAAARKKFDDGVTGQLTTSTPWKFDSVSREIRRRRGLGSFSCWLFSFGGIIYRSPFMLRVRLHEGFKSRLRGYVQTDFVQRFRRLGLPGPCDEIRTVCPSLTRCVLYIILLGYWDKNVLDYSLRYIISTVASWREWLSYLRYYNLKEIMLLLTDFIFGLPLMWLNLIANKKPSCR